MVGRGTFAIVQPHVTSQACLRIEIVDYMAVSQNDHTCGAQLCLFYRIKIFVYAVIVSYQFFD